MRRLPRTEPLVALYWQFWRRDGSHVAMGRVSIDAAPEYFRRTVDVVARRTAGAVRRS